MRRLSALIASLLLLLTLFSSCTKPVANLSAAELLDLGDKYLLDMKYEQAIVYFDRLIEVEPYNPRGYTGLAKAYIALDNTEKAIDILKQGRTLLPDDAALQSLLDEVLPPESSPSSSLDEGLASDQVIEPTPASTQESVPPQDTEGMVVTSDYSLSSFTYSFIWQDKWANNGRAIGAFCLSVTVDDEIQGINNVIGDRYNQVFTNELIDSNIPFLQASAGNVDALLKAYAFPIYQEDLGSSIQIALFTLNEDYEYLGKILLEVQIPDNPA